MEASEHTDHRLGPSEANGRDVTCFSKWSLVSEEDKMSKC